MDLESITRWEDYSRAKDQMLVHTDIPGARWNIVESDDKRSARVNMISHLLSAVPWRPVQPPELTLPQRPPPSGYQRPPRNQTPTSPTAPPSSPPHPSEPPSHRRETRQANV